MESRTAGKVTAMNWTDEISRLKGNWISIDYDMTSATTLQRGTQEESDYQVKGPKSSSTPDDLSTGAENATSK